MMKYERLTGQEWSENIDLTQELGYSYIYKRLYDLENKIEKGTLVELPCKVGDTLYIVGFVSNKYGIFRGVQSVTIDNISVNQDGEYITDIGEYSPDFRIIGKTIYLTREEAENKLKELQNG